jgi:hypothetical protein
LIALLPAAQEAVEELMDEAPDIPLLMEPLFRYFEEISASREYEGMSGMPQAIQMSEIVAWQQLSGMTLDQWELGAIRALDVRFRAARMPKPKENLGGV